MRGIQVLLGASLLVAAQASYAFDDSRKGFILGLGVGLQTISTDFNYYGSTIASESDSGFATSFKIGAGITEQFALYYVNNVSWYSAPFYDGISVKDITVATGISGLGGSYYFSPSAPSAYILGAVGIGSLAAPFESNVTTDTGSAFMVGGGYEMSSHVQLEATYMSTDINSADDTNLNISGSSFQFTVNYLWY